MSHRIIDKSNKLHLINIKNIHRLKIDLKSNIYLPDLHKILPKDDLYKILYIEWKDNNISAFHFHSHDDAFKAFSEIEKKINDDYGKEDIDTIDKIHEYQIRRFITEITEYWEMEQKMIKNPNICCDVGKDELK